MARTNATRAPAIRRAFFRSLVIALALGAAAGQAQAREWTTEEKWTGAAALTLSVIDWAQTRHIAKNPDKWRELNPVLGTNPSVGRVNTYFAMSIAGAAVAAHFMPKWRLPLLRTFVVYQFAVTARNAHVGIRMDF